MNEVENRMVNPTVWTDTPTEVREKLCGSGYRGIGRDVFVPECDAFEYAISQCVEDILPDGFFEIKWTEEFREMIVDWYYSDSEWVKEE